MYQQSYAYFIIIFIDHGFMID